MIMKYYLAPMEGITTYVFRHAYHKVYRPMDKYFTPFIVPHTQKGMSAHEWSELNPENNAGMHVVPQVLTNNAADFVKTAKMLYDYGNTVVNLNLGCPSKTVVSKGRGSGFLDDPGVLDRFFDDVFMKIDKKVSVKTRIGLESPLEFEDILKVYEKYPLSELIIHPRLQTDYYKNTPNWEVFQEAVDHSHHKLCYNGDIFSVEDYRRFMERFPQIDCIMLGRGIVAYPDLVEQIERECAIEVDRAGLNILENVSKMDVGLSTCVDDNMRADKADDAEKYRKLRMFHDLLLEGYKESMSGDRNVLFKMKEFWSYCQHNFPEQPKLWKKIKKCEKLVVYDSLIEEVFSN